MLLLGIETSCDDTATAVVRDGRSVLADVSTNQDAFHRKFGGIVPEIASRQHLALMSAAVEDALDRAGVTLADLDGIAVTAGPGLVGSLVIGVASAKALAYAARKPLYAVNHLHGHIFAPFLYTVGTPPIPQHTVGTPPIPQHTVGTPPIPQQRDAEPEYPFLALLVSGGHSQLVHVDSPVAMTVVARTRDDAAGEAFDKTARLLGLPFPGGPAIDRLARDGDPRAIDFPRHRAERGDLNMSFSGVKTAVKYFLESEPGRNAAPADVAASFQAAVVDVLIDRLERAAIRAPYKAAVLSGGVAANSALRAAFEAWSKRVGIPGLVPSLRFCTDNAAMIAAAADRQGPAVLADPLALAADPNLPFVLPASAISR